MGTRDCRNPPMKSEWKIAADKALEEAQNLPPGSDRAEALKKAGVLRNEACLRDIATVERISK